jgi:hypothetical protein
MVMRLVKYLGLLLLLVVSVGFSLTAYCHDIKESAQVSLPIENWDKSQGWDRGIQLFNKANPAQDAKNNFKLIGSHFIGVAGYSVSYPGLDPKKNKSLFDKVISGEIKTQVVRETSDVIDGKKHQAYINSAKKYTSRYNAAILKLIASEKK